MAKKRAEHDEFLCKCLRIGMSAKFLEDAIDDFALRAGDAEDDFRVIVGRNAAEALSKALCAMNLGVEIIMSLDPDAPGSIKVLCERCGIGDHLALDRDGRVYFAVYGLNYKGEIQID